MGEGGSNGGVVYGSITLGDAVKSLERGFKRCMKAGKGKEGVWRSRRLLRAIVIWGEGMKVRVVARWDGSMKVGYLWW
ncbi:hypothetical protein PVK06_020483 [Gossypium arboreum]|uniref:Uncharacterized protein n=1 Tax=Gossypium arboreum TaxID=29729 RepID=A0ABR0PMH3_GOSAR|nr:hypothetical protein PVK06_020483 [Gossypium arboreum]